MIELTEREIGLLTCLLINWIEDAETRYAVTPSIATKLLAKLQEVKL